MFAEHKPTVFRTGGFPLSDKSQRPRSGTQSLSPIAGGRGQAPAGSNREPVPIPLVRVTFELPRGREALGYRRSGGYVQWPEQGS